METLTPYQNEVKNMNVKERERIGKRNEAEDNMNENIGKVSI